MASYTTDEVVFDLPDGFVDNSITFLLNGSTNAPISLVVTRDRREGSLDDQVNSIIEDLVKDAPGITKVRGLRSREVGNLDAREGKFTTVIGKSTIYVRQAWVEYYGTMVTFTVTSPKAHQQLCDVTADRVLDAVKFRKQ